MPFQQGEVQLLRPARSQVMIGIVHNPQLKILKLGQSSSATAAVQGQLIQAFVAAAVDEQHLGATFGQLAEKSENLGVTDLRADAFSE